METDISKRAASETNGVTETADSSERVRDEATKENACDGLTAEQRARVERQRQRAKAVRDAKEQAGRVAPLPATAKPALPAGGFIPEDDAPQSAPRAVSPHGVPVLHAHERAVCDECGQRFAHSYLLQTFDFPVCDECRDPEGAHGLVTRTEAKSEFLLQDCDLDKRGDGPLKCEKRRNPHRGGHDMRLYLRAAVEARALLVWGSEAALEEEKVRRAVRSQQLKASRGQRRLRALRMDVRSSLYSKPRADHTHRWGPETETPDGDYEHECLECGLKQTYEKM